MQRVIAVFDIGKTNKKLLLFDEKFSIVFQQEQKFPVITDEDGFDCDDIGLIVSWIKGELSRLTETGDYEVTAVNFSTYGASLIFLDEKGERLTPLYNYLKPVSPAIAEDLFRKYGGKNEFCRQTASPALGLLLNSGIQILWMLREKPLVMDKTRSILHLPQYLSYVLTGKVVSEPTSVGCHTFMWNFDKMDYHRWMADNGIELPAPVTNDVVYDTFIQGKKLKVGTGIHDSSASLVPYLKGSEEKFILVSTGTWCINMNPFNEEPLTAYQLEQDCLCFLSPDKRQVKSSRLFMGHFHEVWADRLAARFNTDRSWFKQVRYDARMIEKINLQFRNKSVFFPGGKASFEQDKDLVDLAIFESYEEAYTKLMADLTCLCAQSVRLVIPERDETRCLYISGGFARNELFIRLLQEYFPEKEVYTSEVDNSSALGAALAVTGALENAVKAYPDLGLKKWSL